MARPRYPRARTRRTCAAALLRRFLVGHLFRLLRRLYALHNDRRIDAEVGRDEREHDRAQANAAGAPKRTPRRSSTFWLVRRPFRMATPAVTKGLLYTGCETGEFLDAWPTTAEYSPASRSAIAAADQVAA